MAASPIEEAVALARQTTEVVQTEAEARAVKALTEPAWFRWPRPDGPDYACEVGPFWANVIRGADNPRPSWGWEVWDLRVPESPDFVGGGFARNLVDAQVAAEEVLRNALVRE